MNKSVAKVETAREQMSRAESHDIELKDIGSALRYLENTAKKAGLPFLSLLIGVAAVAAQDAAVAGGGKVSKLRH